MRDTDEATRKVSRKYYYGYKNLEKKINPVIVNMIIRKKITLLFSFLLDHIFVFSCQIPLKINWETEFTGCNG